MEETEFFHTYTKGYMIEENRNTREVFCNAIKLFLKLPSNKNDDVVKR